MRWLFLGLLIVNALYFVWSQQDFTNNAIEDKPVVLPSKATQGQVQLVSEVPELQKQPLSAGLRQEQQKLCCWAALPMSRWRKNYSSV